jgi:hypothetical protein
LAGRRPWLVTALLCAAVVGGGVYGGDLPAQEYRAWLFRAHGALVWDDHWYGGHTLTGYSLLFPPLAALFGAITLGVLSCVASTAGMTRLVRGRARAGHELALVWFAVVTVVNLVVGRLSFALGFALGIWAVAAARERRRVLATLAAATCGLASPLAGVFLLLVALAGIPRGGWRRMLPLSAAVVGPVLALLFGEGVGRFPFPAGTFATVLVFVGIGLWLAPRRSVIRRALALYGLAAVVLFFVPNAVGGNVIRLGALLAGPVAAWELMRTGRRRVLALLAAPLLFWQLEPVPTAVAYSAVGRSDRPAYYAGLLHYLIAHGAADGRVEIPLTAAHWETAYVAPYVPLARGWERQVDIADNQVLYRPGLTAREYESWLVADGVRFVALSDAPLDPSAQAEAAILEEPHPWLVPVWSDAHWQVWQVLGARRLVTGVARLVDLGVDSFTVRAARAGWSTVLVHWTKFWSVTAGDACVLPSPDGQWTQLYVISPGKVTVGASLQLDRLGGASNGPFCADRTTATGP